MCWWVQLGLFSLECSELSSCEFWGVYGFGMALGSLLMLRVVFLFCWRTNMLYLALELIGSLVDSGFSLGMETFR